MNLSDAGESRIRGYLFMLEQSLRTFLRRDVAADAVREVESHIRERVLEDNGMPNERDALNRLLEAMGPPHRLARAYSAELAVDEAVTTGRFGATVRAVFAMAFYTTEGFFVALGLMYGYLISIGLLLVAILKPIFPSNVGLFTVNGRFLGIGLQIHLPPGTVVSYGWLVPLVGAVVGSLGLWMTHRGTRAYLRRVRRRRKGSFGDAEFSTVARTS
jgi:uncharacterized membrane protein